MTDWINQFDGLLEVNPPLGEDLLARLPAKRGLFLLLAEGERPVVMLSAADIRSRLRTRLQNPPPDQARKKTADLRAITTKILWKLADSSFEADLNYLELARAIWPGGFAKLLAWKGGWFVHVDPSEKFPHFSKTNGQLPSNGRCFGPFGSGKSAQRFIDAIVDAFDLCRDYRCLVKSPHGQPCAYLQMGRCLGPCDGTISLEDYRIAVARAADFAAGGRAEYRQELIERMKDASGRMEYEKASAIKARLDRLAELDGPEYRHVAPLEQFRFIVIRHGPTRRQMKVFLVDRGLIVSFGVLRYPLVAAELEAVLARMSRLVDSPDSPGRDDRWRLALVASYLYSGDRRKGLMLRWRNDFTANQLAAAVDSSAGNLSLKARLVGRRNNSVFFYALPALHMRTLE